jgi:hypothetical protein
MEELLDKEDFENRFGKGYEARKSEIERRPTYLQGLLKQKDTVDSLILAEESEEGSDLKLLGISGVDDEKRKTIRKEYSFTNEHGEEELLVITRPKSIKPLDGYREVFEGLRQGFESAEGLTAPALYGAKGATAVMLYATDGVMKNMYKDVSDILNTDLMKIRKKLFEVYDELKQKSVDEERTEEDARRLAVSQRISKDFAKESAKVKRILAAFGAGMFWKVDEGARKRIERRKGKQ